YTVVDARTGTVLWRKDIRYHVGGPDRLPAKFKVFVQRTPAGACPSNPATNPPAPTTSPAPASSDSCTNNPSNGQHQRIDLCPDIEAADWIDGPKTTATTTGNNADVYLDLSG